MNNEMNEGINEAIEIRRRRDGETIKDRELAERKRER
jgi:hypothetical protein